MALVTDRSVVEQDSVRPSTDGTGAFDIFRGSNFDVDSITTVPEGQGATLMATTHQQQTDGFVVASSMGDPTSANLLEGDNLSNVSGTNCRPQSWRLLGSIGYLIHNGGKPLKRLILHNVQSKHQEDKN